MRTFLAAVLSTVALASCSADGGGSSGTPAAPPEPETVVVLRPGQTEVSGVLTGLTASAAVGPPVAAPFTVTVPARGEGGATISNAVVGGRRTTIVWDGGRPLPVSGTGTVDVGAARIEVTPAAIRWFLDGQPRVLTPGRYRLGATVAVGQRGLATPTDGATFDVDGQAAMVTRGGARVELPPADVALEGPGAVELRGRLRLRTASGSQDAASARFGEGAYRVKLSPAPGGYRIDALFQGPRAG